VSNYYLYHQKQTLPPTPLYITRQMIIIRRQAWAKFSYGNATGRSTALISYGSMWWSRVMLMHKHMQSVKTYANRCTVWKCSVSLSPKQLASMSLFTAEA